MIKSSLLDFFFFYIFFHSDSSMHHIKWIFIKRYTRFNFTTFGTEARYTFKICLLYYFSFWFAIRITPPITFSYSRFFNSGIKISILIFKRDCFIWRCPPIHCCFSISFIYCLILIISVLLIFCLVFKTICWKTLLMIFYYIHFIIQILIFNLFKVYLFFYNKYYYITYFLTFGVLGF